MRRVSLREARADPGPPDGARPVIAIQARMGSTRFPGKVLADLGGHKVLDWVYERARASSLTSTSVVLTSSNDGDDAIEAWAASAGVPCLRGSENDVLSRYVHLCERVHPPAVVRITADCPLIDPGVIDAVVTAWWRQGDPADYASNTLMRTFPDGLDAEVVSCAVLEVLDSEARGDHREHVTSYIAENALRFDCVSVELDVDCSSARVTLDTPADLAELEAIVKGAAHPLEGPRLDDLLYQFGCVKD